MDSEPKQHNDEFHQSKVIYVDLIRQLLTESELSIKWDEYSAYQKHIDLIGNWLWMQVVHKRVGNITCSELLEHAYYDHLLLESSIIRVLGFGYEISDKLFSHFLPNYNSSKSGTVEGSIFNLTTSFYDLMCDELGRAHLINNLITPNYLTNALFGTGSRSHILKSSNDDIYMSFLKRLVESFFQQWRSFARNSQNTIVIEDCRNSIIEMYQAHMRLQDMSKFPCDWSTLREYCRIKSCLPTWVMLGLGIMSYQQKIPHLQNISEFKANVMNFAEILWLVDDLVDIFEDVTTNRFNMFLESTTQYDGFPHNVNLQEIASYGIYEISKRFNMLEHACSTRTFNDTLMMIKCLLRSWIN